MALKRSNEADMVGTTSSVIYQSDDHEETSRIPQKIPPLKLRIKDKVKDTKYSLTLGQKFTHEIVDAQNSTEKLTALLRLTENFPLEINIEEAEQILRTLKDIIKKEFDPLLKGKACHALGEILKVPGLNKLMVADDMFEILQKEGHHHVVVHILKVMCTIGQLLPSKVEMIQKILKLAIKKLTDSHHDVRCICLNLVSQLCPKEPMKMSGGRVIDFPELFAEFSTDQDSRVRSNSLQALLILHQRGQPLDANVYEKASTALSDDYEDVRMVAVKLIWVLSHLYPERMIVHPSTGDDVRLLDDAFTKICNMVNDGSMKLRAQAMGLLGSLHSVSSSYLEQTLDKKLMSRFVKRKSVNEREKDRFQGESSGGSGSGWSTGKQWGDNNTVPDKKFDADEVSLMNSGACGAFVRGLEDEFMEVRTAAVDSLCELANQNASFAAMSTDFLVDMFNDEIQTVRLNSISSLIKLSDHVDLREDQLDTVLNVLNDFSWDIRASVRDLLAHCQFSTQPCLHATILAFLKNMQLYTEDRSHIWRCLQSLGKRHPHSVSSLIPDLLSTHPFYATPERNLEDPQYIGMAILVFNAAVSCPPIRSLLPEHIKRHYDYLRDSLPNLVPEIRHVARQDKSNQKSENTAKFFQNAITRAQSIEEIDGHSACKVLDVCIQDFQHLVDIDENLEPNAQFQALYLRCLLLLFKARIERTWTVPAPLCHDNSSVLSSTVEQLLALSYRMESTFSGLGNKDISSIKLIRILAHALQMVLATRSTYNKSMERKQQELDSLQLFLDRIRFFREDVRSLAETDHVGLETVLNCEKLLEERSYSIAEVLSYLQNLFLKCPVKLVRTENQLREAKAVIVEPTGNSDNPLKFLSGLTLGINLHANLENLEDTSNVFVQILYPDKKSHLTKPKSSDFKKLTSFRHNLRTTVLLSHHTWTDPCHVELSLVMSYKPDVNEETVLSFSRQNLASSSSSKSCKTNKDDVKNGLISLSEPVKVYVQPRTKLI